MYSNVKNLFRSWTKPHKMRTPKVKQILLYHGTQFYAVESIEKRKGVIKFEKFLINNDI